MRAEVWPGGRSGADLVWGVRESFLRYVEAVGGAVEVITPATRTAEGPVRFPLVRETPELAEYSGGLSFHAHHGALRVSFCDPRLERPDADADAALLSVIDASAEPPARIVLATIDQTGGVALADGGLAIFDFHYPAETVLDPIAFADPPSHE